jgi:ferredoxin
MPTVRVKPHRLISKTKLLNCAPSIIRRCSITRGRGVAPTLPPADRQIGSGEDTMADPALRLPTNAPGPVFVDRTCIDCAACRRLAPSVFDHAGGRSYVRRQPYIDEEIAQTLRPSSLVRLARSATSGGVLSPTRPRRFRCGSTVRSPNSDFTRDLPTVRPVARRFACGGARRRRLG